MQQRVLITGASGFVGYHLVEKCIGAGLEVFAAVRKTSITRHLKSMKLHYTQPDFSNVASLQKEIAYNKYDYIIHAAGTTKAHNAEEYNHINSSYTANLANAIAQSSYPVTKTVFMSSLGAIGPSLQYDEAINENKFPEPVTAYGKSKLLAEKLVAGFNIPVTILRPTAVYGPREKDIFIILKTISRGFEPYIGKIQQQLSFVYVKDLAEITFNALLSPISGTYNITDGNCYNRYDLGAITRQLLDVKTIRFHLPFKTVGSLAAMLERGYGLLNKTSILNKEKLNELTAMNWCCDISKAKTDLNFEPKYDLQKGLTETISWYKENRWL